MSWESIEENRRSAPETLIDDVIAGSIPAWHEFLSEYSELIYRVIARHLPAEDPDTTQNVYVDLLRSLYNGGLQKYRKSGSIHGWLAVVARRRAVDHVRSKYGRKRPPSCYDQLTRLEKDVFELYFLEYGSLEMLLEMLKWRGHEVSSTEVVAAIVRIESVVDAGYLHRLHYDRQARSRGLPSAAAMEFVTKTRWEFERQAHADRPDSRLAAQEAEETARQLRLAIEQLPQEDRTLLALRFEEGLGAKEISQKLNIGGRRKAYTALDRIIRRLRTRLNAGRTSGE